LHRLRRAPRFPWSVPAGIVSSTAVLWILIRLLIAAFMFSLGRFWYVEGGRVSALTVAVVVGLQLYHARRTNERVFTENLGLPEAVGAGIAFLTAMTCEVLLNLARNSSGNF